LPIKAKAEKKHHIALDSFQILFQTPLTALYRWYKVFSNKSRIKEGKMLIIDKFEDEFAVVETDKGFVDIPKSDLPADAKEGDVLTLSLDKTSTVERKERVDWMIDNLFKS
jgi:hypothetical protein